MASAPAFVAQGHAGFAGTCNFFGAIKPVALLHETSLPFPLIRGFSFRPSVRSEMPGISAAHCGWPLVSVSTRKIISRSLSSSGTGLQLSFPAADSNCGQE